MRTINQIAFLSIGLLLAGLSLRAGLVTEPFSTITKRNAFRLSPPNPESRPLEVQRELPEITLQGLANLNSQQALLKIVTKTKPIAVEVSCILAAGQSHEGVKVLRIDMKSGSVWLTNQGAEQLLTLWQ